MANDTKIKTYRKCRKCLKIKNQSEFYYFQSTGIYTLDCKICVRLQEKRRYESKNTTILKKFQIAQKIKRELTLKICRKCLVEQPIANYNVSKKKVELNARAVFLNEDQKNTGMKKLAVIL